MNHAEWDNYGAEGVFLHQHRGLPIVTDCEERDLYCGLQYVLRPHAAVDPSTASSVFLDRPSSNLYMDRFQA